LPRQARLHALPRQVLVYRRRPSKNATTNGDDDCVHKAIDTQLDQLCMVRRLSSLPRQARLRCFAPVSLVLARRTMIAVAYRRRPLTTATTITLCAVTCSLCVLCRVCGEFQCFCWVWGTSTETFSLSIRRSEVLGVDQGPGGLWASWSLWAFRPAFSSLRGFRCCIATSLVSFREVSVAAAGLVRLSLHVPWQFGVLSIRSSAIRPRFRWFLCCPACFVLAAAVRPGSLFSFSGMGPSMECTSCCIDGPCRRPSGRVLRHGSPDFVFPA
jgi:hypothetical protein